ncbi:Receptor-like protein 53 [Bienertia sinuspersici]
MDLSENHFTNMIPYSIGKLSKLETLLMNDNKLNGPIPNSIALEQNKLNCHIPNSIGQMSQLKTLKLHLNKLTGPIPKSVENSPNCNYLSL